MHDEPHRESKRLAKEYPVQVRLDAYERERLEALAAAWGMTLSATLRRLIREAHLHPANANH
jgi:hypothetical protein